MIGAESKEELKQVEIIEPLIGPNEAEGRDDICLKVLETPTETESGCHDKSDRAKEVNKLEVWSHSHSQGGHSSESLSEKTDNEALGMKRLSEPCKKSEGIKENGMKKDNAERPDSDAVVLLCGATEMVLLPTDWNTADSPDSQPGNVDEPNEVSDDNTHAADVEDGGKKIEE
jgi:hypothetical protein